MTPLLRPLPSGDLRLQFLAVGFQQYEGFAVDGDLNRVTDDQPLAGIAGMAPNTLSPCGINNVCQLHRKDGPSHRGAFIKALVRTDIHEPSRLEVVLRASKHDSKHQHERSAKQPFVHVRSEGIHHKPNLNVAEEAAA